MNELIINQKNDPLRINISIIDSNINFRIAMRSKYSKRLTVNRVINWRQQQCSTKARPAIISSNLFLLVKPELHIHFIIADGNQKLHFWRSFLLFLTAGAKTQNKWLNKVSKCLKELYLDLNDHNLFTDRSVIIW